MAVKTYRALRKGYVDGKIVGPDDANGGIFTTEFKEVVREDPSPAAMKRFEEKGGVKPVGSIKRDKDGNAVMKSADAPSWAEEVKGKTAAVERMVADAQDPDNSDDPNLEEMSRPALEAYAAERHVQFTKKVSDDDLRTAIRAAADPTR